MLPKDNKKLSCLTIYQGAFWDEGDNAQELQADLIANPTFEINGQPLGNPEISMLAMYPRDEYGNITEKFGANLDFCYLLDFPAGYIPLHLRTVIYTAKFIVTHGR